MAESIITMRTPFPDHQVSKLPKGTKAQNGCPADEKKNCAICGGWHHPKIKHLDYVGHAALTDRLLDVDPSWYWEPLALKDGLPAFDAIGGLWIKLTVNSVTRIGYGNAELKEHMDKGAREKEVIGDALRNAGMRFGAALDLWHKGELHLPEPVDEQDKQKPALEPLPHEKLEILMHEPIKTKIPEAAAVANISESAIADYIATMDSAVNLEELASVWKELDALAREMGDANARQKFVTAKDIRKARFTIKLGARTLASDPPYTEVLDK